MIVGRSKLGLTRILIHVIITSAMTVASASAQSVASPSARVTMASPKSSLPALRSHYLPNRFPKRATSFYELVWGVDSLSVKSTEAGEIIRFSYRVLDANKAKPLNDKKIEPVLMDERARVKLVVPSLEKVGQLRQTSAPEAGKLYWMAFSNKGRLVKPGDHVSVAIGNFRANGLVVQ